MSQTHSLMEISGLLGVNRVTVTQWLHEGCPSVERADQGFGRQWKLSLPAVVAWLRKRDVDRAVGETSKLDIEEARRRKTAAEASLAELDLAKQRGEVVSIDLVAKVIGQQFGACRQRLMPIATKLAPLVMASDDLAECRSLIEGALREALDELVGFLPGDPEGAAPAGPGDAAQGEPEAAAGADGQSVGGPVPKTQRRGKRGAGPVGHAAQ